MDSEFLVTTHSGTCNKKSATGVDMETVTYLDSASTLFYGAVKLEKE